MIRAIIRGMGYVEGYGDHPGTVPLIFFLLLGLVASRSWVGPAIMGLAFGPFYLWGAYERGKGR